MASRHHDPDDLFCRPVVFVTYDPDNSAEKTFFIREAWPKTERMGELVVHETPNGPLVKLFWEMNSDFFRHTDRDS
jgi:hypothetical protein